MAWNYLADIESDMSVFHRIDDARAMPAQRFIDLALRLPAYSGVMRRRLEKLAMDEDEENGTAPSSTRGQGVNGENRYVPSDNLDTLANDPDFAGSIEIVKG